MIGNPPFLDELEYFARNEDFPDQIGSAGF
jgi:hypothetical protein